VQDLVVWMQGSSLAEFVRNSRFAWAWLEVSHFIGMSMLFGSILVMDMRLMGFFRDVISIRAVRALAPWAALGFAINLASGIVFLVKDAERLLPNPSFQFKMVCILAAGINLLFFAVKFGKSSIAWRDDVDPPIPAKLVGAVSLVAWILVIWGGRMIPVYGEG
jgi:hypothetical protein